MMMPVELCIKRVTVSIIIVIIPVVLIFSLVALQHASVTVHQLSKTETVIHSKDDDIYDLVR